MRKTGSLPVVIPPGRIPGFAAALGECLLPWWKSVSFMTVQGWTKITIARMAKTASQSQCLNSPDLRPFASIDDNADTTLG
jgi:hypothetical protein